MHAAMFDFAWSEIALIGVVALVAIGPKDLPVAIKAVAAVIKKARKMAGEFQVHVDEMVREADLHEVRQEFNNLRSMDIKGKILNAMDGDGTLRKTMAENPLAASTTLTTPPPPAEAAVPPAAEHTILPPDATPISVAEAASHPLAPGSLVPAPPAAVAVPAAAPHPFPDAAPSLPPPADAKQPSLHG